MRRPDEVCCQLIDKDDGPLCAYHGSNLSFLESRANVFWGGCVSKLLSMGVLGNMYVRHRDIVRLIVL